MDYKKKSISKISNDTSYEEIDTRLASGWYVDSVDNNKKKSLNKLSNDSSYEEIDTRLASGWYVDSFEDSKKKKYRTKKVSYKISKKI